MANNIYYIQSDVHPIFIINYMLHLSNFDFWNICEYYETIFSDT